MQINNISTSYDAYVNVAHARKATHKDEAASREAADDRGVTMSESAKEYQHAKKALSGVPDVRHEKVAAVKSNVENGSYKVPAHDIASKIMSDYFA